MLVTRSGAKQEEKERKCEQAILEVKEVKQEVKEVQLAHSGRHSFLAAWQEVR